MRYSRARVLTSLVPSRRRRNPPPRIGGRYLLICNSSPLVRQYISSRNSAFQGPRGSLPWSWVIGVHIQSFDPGSCFHRLHGRCARPRLPRDRHPDQPGGQPPPPIRRVFGVAEGRYVVITSGPVWCLRLKWLGLIGLISKPFGPQASSELIRNPCQVALTTIAATSRITSSRNMIVLFRNISTCLTMLFGMLSAQVLERINMLAERSRDPAREKAAR